MKKNVNLGLALTRVSIGFPMLFYGVNKLFNGIDFIQQLLINNGLPGLLGYGVYLGEIVAPLFILIGLRTRIASLIFSINCITAILLAKSQHVFELNSSGGWSIERSRA